ncbi:hypothetical protein [Porphyrobacter sp. AAP82]|uniref:hypothetical protein n=1 Tax=Porphyrobacter sp. AAP82 TaxID=1248917 RepID=UPI0002EEC3DD|nr:hypothetical protein [Porphyrobacter sp. AAP82]
MSDSGFASLGPSLLARKGGAKPAMRPQVAPLVAEEAAVVPEEALEDLGWNDMGDSDGEGGAQIVPISADLNASPATAGPGPIVRRQQRRLEERVLADAAMTGPEDREPEYDEDGAEDEDEEAPYGEVFDSADYDADEEDEDADTAIYSPLVPQVSHVPQAAPAPAPVPRVAAAPSARRAAFTLRLDADRHLKLRLAATMQGVSAQVLVTEALDRLLAEYDELDVIANHLKRH